MDLICIISFGAVHEHCCSVAAARVWPAGLLHPEGDCAAHLQRVACPVGNHSSGRQLAVQGRPSGVDLDESCVRDEFCFGRCVV